MPTRILRRSPASEKAAIYSYGDLLKDIVLKKLEKDKAQSDRMLAGTMTESDEADLFLSGVGGMLKVVGTGKLLAGMLKGEQKLINMFQSQGYGKHDLMSLTRQARGSRGVFKEALKVPEKEYRRIRDIEWTTGGEFGNKGEYSPLTKKIGLHPKLEDLGTIWHEFTHARQWNPEKGEETTAGVLRFLNEELARKSGLSGRSDFYYNISPVEKHARNVGRSMVEEGSSSKFSSAYRRLLNLAVAEGEKRVGPKLTKDFWEIVLQIGGGK